MPPLGVRATPPWRCPGAAQSRRRRKAMSLASAKTSLRNQPPRPLAYRPLICVLAIGAAAISLFSSLPTAHAGDGDLDPTFGEGGKVLTDFNLSTDIANAVAA